MLKDVFGPSKEEIWQQLSQEINAEFVDGSFWKGRSDRVEAKFKEWVITLDTFNRSSGQTTIPFTRLRAPFINKDGFRFKIYKGSVFSGLGKLFGMQDIEIGDVVFDEKFIIQGNDEGKVKKLFKNPTIKKLLLEAPKVNFEIKDDEGFFKKNKYEKEGADLLYFETYGTLKKLEELKLLYALFAAVLNQLCHMDSAYEIDPGIAV
ncbi:DUF3137 domain-containing protein [Flammeovirgaceae bacterium SG7u.111]|nr:DUF3137 domain-containing protein [Flammeovirgaceae bacterium SG7u.132]WPO36417.1 DUF3137 domain-containing protein [Flammeovirgaceae bacterium SG7u.111]